MIGEFTEECHTLEQIARNNGLDIDNKLSNFISDIVSSKEQKLTKENNEEIALMLKEQSVFDKTIAEVCGGFYFNFYGRLNGKDDAMLFRFLYLCSYLNYDGYLVNERRLVNDEKLQKILNLKRSAYYDTKKYLLDNNLIYFDDGGYAMVNTYYCKKGKAGRIKNIEVIRMFNNSVKYIYEKSKPTEHKKLALFVKLIPYMNFKFNVLCLNVDCEYIEHIIPITLKDVADILGYGKTNTTKLKRDLFKIKFNDELVVLIVEGGYGKYITINPKLMYKSTNSLEEFSDTVEEFKKDSIYRMGMCK